MDAFRRVDSPRRTDLIIQQIRQAILDGELKPADKLPPERELVKRFRTSRIPVREAIKSLEASGLLVVKRGSGVYVAETDSTTMSNSLYSILRIQNSSLAEITQARLMFEPITARAAAARITGEDIGRLEANIGKTAAMLGARQPVTAENIEFHCLVAEAVHNTVVTLTMRTLLNVAREMTEETSGNLDQRIHISNRSLAQHRTILEALVDKDEDKAYRLMLDHVKEIQDAVPKVSEDELKDTSKRRLNADKTGDDDPIRPDA